MTEPNKNNTVDNVELENNVSLVDEQDTSHNKLDCDEIHKIVVTQTVKMPILVKKY